MPLSIREHVPLREMTTFRIGGPARYFCAVTNEAELVEAVAWAEAHRKNARSAVSFFILGGGSNILVADGGFEGLVIKMEMKGISFQCSEADGRESVFPKRHRGRIGQLITRAVFSLKNPERMADNRLQTHQKFQLSEKTGVTEKEDSNSGIVCVTAGAGENWDAFVGACVERGLGGLENLSGIPGTVGAAPVQNIGAYGAEVSQTIFSVRVFDALKNVFSELSNRDCRFRYRDSIFKHEKNPDGSARHIITSVSFNLKKNASINSDYKDIREYFLKHAVSGPGIADMRQAVLAIRAAKLPDVRNVGTAGSFFKNPIISQEHFADLAAKYRGLPSFPVEGDLENKSVKVPLAWILDHVCGYKGVKKGSIGTYKNQALVIVNDFSGSGGPAAASEIRKFAADIASAVKEKTGIIIEPEVQYVG